MEQVLTSAGPEDDATRIRRLETAIGLLTRNPDPGLSVSEMREANERRQREAVARRERREAEAREEAAAVRKRDQPLLQKRERELAKFTGKIEPLEREQRQLSRRLEELTTRRANRIRHAMVDAARATQALGLESFETHLAVEPRYPDTTEIDAEIVAVLEELGPLAPQIERLRSERGRLGRRPLRAGPARETRPFTTEETTHA